MSGAGEEFLAHAAALMGEGLIGCGAGGDVGAPGRHLHADRLRVQGDVVVILHRVLGRELPVSRPLALVVEDFDLLADAVVRDRALHRRHHRLQRARLVVQVDEQESHPAVEPVLRQGAGAFVEDLAFLHMRGPDQSSVGGIGPGVIGTDEPAGVAVALGHEHAPVTADRIQRAHLAIPAAHDDHRFAHHVDRVEIAGFGDILLAPNAEPGLLEDLLHFEGVKLGRGIGVPRQREARRIGQSRIFGEIVEQGAEGLRHLQPPVVADPQPRGCHGEGTRKTALLGRALSRPAWLPADGAGRNRRSPHGRVGGSRARPEPRGRRPA